MHPVSLGELLAAASAAWAEVSPVEAVAAALASTTLYLYVFYRARLYMQAALQVYYIVIALYAWRAWRRSPAGVELKVTHASWRSQALGLAAVLLVSAASATWLARATGSRDPLLDSLTTWASVFTTWLVARKKIENWPWWLAVDTLIVVLCWRGRLYSTMILYGLYLGLVLMGWRSWSRDLRGQAHAGGAA